MEEMWKMFTENMDKLIILKYSIYNFKTSFLKVNKKNKEVIEQTLMIVDES